MSESNEGDAVRLDEGLKEIDYVTAVRMLSGIESEVDRAVPYVGHLISDNPDASRFEQGLGHIAAEIVGKLVSGLEHTLAAAPRNTRDHLRDQLIRALGALDWDIPPR